MNFLFTLFIVTVLFGGHSLAIEPSEPAAKMQIIAPVIAPPPAPIHDVRKYGAVGDGKTYDTQALQKAIDACAGTGGSVLLAKGTFLTAVLTIKGGMTLYIAPDAVLLGGTMPVDYP
jgi:polygalacturonase